MRSLSSLLTLRYLRPMFLRLWAAWGSGRASPRQLGPSPGPLLPPGELERVAELQWRLIDYLCSLGRAARSGSLASLTHRLSTIPSTLPGAGRGAFLAAGSLHPGDVLTLYPGLVHDLDAVHAATSAAALCDDEAFDYSPPAFTLDNHYLASMRCLGRTFLVDGCPGGLSAQRFRLAAAGGEGGAVNASWLEETPMAECSLGGGAASSSSDQQQPAGAELASSSQDTQQQALLQQAALGHLLNHQPAPRATAAFDLCPLPAGLPPTLLHFVPNLNAGGAEPEGRWVAMVRALAPLAAGSPASPTGSEGSGGAGAAGSSDPIELFVDYGSDPLSLGYHP